MWIVQGQSLGTSRNGFKLNNQHENTKHPPVPRQKILEKNAMSGEKAGLRKTAMNVE